MATNLNQSRVAFEVDLLSQAFGYHNVVCASAFQWIKLNRFDLPRDKFNFPYTNVLLILPHDYGYGTGLEELYFDSTLRFRNGNQLPHYYQSNPYNRKDYSLDGWHYYCIHPTWHSDDNILTFLNLIDISLQKL